jgi:hypothetical protein
MDVFRFDDKLFQRGNTFSECIEWWFDEREAFLRRVDQKIVLRQTLEQANQLPSGTGVAVYFSNYLLESALTLPWIGRTLDGLKDIEVRFFCKEFFFPVLSPAFGRQTPKIAVLNKAGFPVQYWGPRPEQLESRIHERRSTGESLDQFLANLDSEEFAEMLDRSLATYFELVRDILSIADTGLAPPDASEAAEF